MIVYQSVPPAFPWFHVLPQLFVTSHSKLLVELQSLRTELDRSIYHRVALIPLLDRFPESKLDLAWFWFQDVLLQTHVLPLFPQAAGNATKTRQKVRRSKSSTAQVDLVQHGMGERVRLEECRQLYPPQVRLPLIKLLFYLETHLSTDKAFNNLPALRPPHRC